MSERTEEAMGRPRVSPESIDVGRAVANVSLGPIARLFPAEHWHEPANTGGGAIFAGRADEVALNVEQEPDKESVPPGQFNLDSHIYDRDSGHPVPYLDVTVAVARDGKVLFDELPLLPVARPIKGTAGLHYGNNVALDPHGTYQVTLSVVSSPLIGNAPSGPMVFTVDFGD